MTSTDQLVDTQHLLDAITSMQQRAIGILDGLEEYDLRRPVLPSGWSCLGMAQHLTGMTWFWFVEVMGGRLGENPVGDGFDVPDDAAAADVLGAMRIRLPQADAAVEHLPLSTAPAWWPDDLFGPWRLHSLAEVLTHVLVETSCHTGHLDAARELIDGRTWDWSRGRLADVPV
jgi:hypothetical protein